MLLGRLRTKTESSTLTALCHRIAPESAPFSRLRNFSMNFATQWRARRVRAPGAREEGHPSGGTAARRAAEHFARLLGRSATIQLTVTTTSRWRVYTL